MRILINHSVVHARAIRGSTSGDYICYSPPKLGNRGFMRPAGPISRDEIFYLSKNLHWQYEKLASLSSDSIQIRIVLHCSLKSGHGTYLNEAAYHGVNFLNNLAERLASLSFDHGLRTVTNLTIALKITIVELHTLVTSRKFWGIIISHNLIKLVLPNLIPQLVQQI